MCDLTNPAFTNEQRDHAGGWKRQKMLPLSAAGFPQCKMHSLALSDIENVALIFRNDEREPRDFGREVAYFNATKIGQWNFALAPVFLYAAC
jgi:hypothetical protein